MSGVPVATFPHLSPLPFEPLPPPVDDVKRLEAAEARLNAVLESLTRHKGAQPLGVQKQPDGALRLAAADWQSALCRIGLRARGKCVPTLRL